MNSKDYWRNRENEQHKHNITEEKKYNQELNKIYKDMMDECKRSINNFYAKYASENGITMAEAKKRASKLDIEEYARKAAKYVKTKDFTKEANDAMKIYNLTMKVNRLELLKADLGLELAKGHSKIYQLFYKALKKRSIDEFKRQSGILGKTVQNNTKLANSIVNASFHNATFSDRIWMHQDLLKNDLNKLLQIGLIQGKNPKTLATELRKRFNVKQSDAERLMQTELARVQTDAQKKSYIENGFDEYEYIACGSSDVCDTCKSMDGKVFKVKDMMPGLNAPPMHPRCHCSTAPHIDRAEYESWLDFLEKGGTTEEWEAQKRFKSNMNKQLNKLSESEKSILNRYTGIFAFQLNSSLNHGKYDKYQNEINILDNALSKGVILEDITLRRKVDLGFFVEKSKYNIEDLKKLIGIKIIEKGYSSTSLNLFDDIDLKGRNGFIEFDVPKGYKGAQYIKNLAYPKFKNQEEVLFNRGLCYIINEVREENGIYYIKAEVLKND